MIARLAGQIAAIEADRCIVDVAGVGYLVQASSRSLAAFPPPPAQAVVLVETQVREDAILLYGFADAAERDWFRLLTTVQGVGGRVALAILSALSPRELIAAIASGDRASLTRANGVGARLAVRLLTELRDKAGAMPGSAGPGNAGLGSAGIVMPPAPASAAGDALSALVNLGYRRAEVVAALSRVAERLGAGSSLDALIREGLRELAPGEAAR
jgi:Holliday junction DNA helicase RuvA